jgi:hypothetical protein
MADWKDPDSAAVYSCIACSNGRKKILVMIFSSLSKILMNLNYDSKVNFFSG